MHDVHMMDGGGKINCCFIFAAGPASSDLLIYLSLLIDSFDIIMLTEYKGKLFCPRFHVLLMILRTLEISDLFGDNAFATFQERFSF